MDIAVQKLSHPLEEIRVRALHAIAAKVNCGIWPNPSTLPRGVQSQLSNALSSLAKDYPEAQNLLKMLSTPVPEPISLPKRELSKEEPLEMTIDTKNVENGWCFPFILLSERDDKALLELEVKIKLQTTPSDLIKLLEDFQQSLLLDFPSQVFLQRPLVLEYLLHLICQPTLESVEYGQVYFNYPKAPSTMKLVLVVLEVLQHLVSAWTTAYHLVVNGSFTVFEQEQDNYKYPAVGMRHFYDGWSFSGALHTITLHLLNALLQPNSPQAQILTLISSIRPSFVVDSNDNARSIDKMLEKISEVLSSLCNGTLVYCLMKWLTSILELVHDKDTITLSSAICDCMESLVLDEDLFQLDKEFQERLQTLLAKYQPEAIEKIQQYTRHRELESKCVGFLKSAENLNGQETEQILAKLLLTAEELIELVPRLESSEKINGLLRAISQVACVNCQFDSQFDSVVKVLHQISRFLPSSNGHYEVIYSYSISIPTLQKALEQPDIIFGLCQRLFLHPETQCLWNLVYNALSNTSLPSAVLPYLQHWAYAEEPFSQHHEIYQENFAKLLHSQQESNELLLRARCLFHHSEYIRKAAIAGLNELLQLACPDDVFSSDEFEEELKNYSLLHHNYLGPQPKNDAKLVEKFVMWLSMLQSDSLDVKVKVTALTQIAAKMNDIADTSLLIASGVMRSLVEFVMQWLSTLPPCASTLLIVVESILRKSRIVRDWMREHHNWLATLITCALNQDDSLLPSTYFCLFYVTLSLEIWSSSENDMATIPRGIENTFGPRSIEMPTEPIYPDISWSLSKPTSVKLLQWSSMDIIQALESAQSHRNYANRLYDFFWLCQIHPKLYLPKFISSIQPFLRFLETYPCSPKDILTLSAILRTLATIIPHLDDAVSIIPTILVRLRTHVIPVIKQLKSLYNEMIKLSAAMATSSKSMALLVAAFLAEVDLISYMQANGFACDVASLETSTILCTLRLLTLINQAQEKGSKWFASVSESFVPPLLNIFQCQYHHDTFQKKAIILYSLQCIHSIAEKTDVPQGNLLDLSRRNLFDMDSRIRTMAFTLLSHLDSIDEQLVELSTGTVVDTKECFKVREAAVRIASWSKPLDSILGDASFLSPSFVFALLCQWQAVEGTENVSLPWLKLLSVDYYYDCCKKMALLSMNISSASKSYGALKGFTACFEEEWQSRHLSATVSCIRKTLSILLGMEQQPSHVLLMHPISKLLEWQRVQALHPALLCDILSFLSVHCSPEAPLPDFTCSQIVESLIQTTSNRFQNPMLLEQVLIPAAALVPKLQSINQVLPRLEVFCEQILIILLHLDDNSSYRLVHALATLVEFLACFPFAMSIVRRRGVVASLWRNFTKTFNLLRLGKSEGLNWFALYADTLGSVIAGNEEAQNEVMELGLALFMTSNWKSPAKYDTCMEACLGLLINYAYRNRKTKRSLALEPRIGAPSLQSFVWDFALTSHSKLAFTLLKSLHLCLDCVLVSIKRGYVQKAFEALEDCLNKAHKAKKLMDSTLIELLVDVIANIASFEEGRSEINRFDHVHEILTDLLNAQVYPTTVLWIRHMACTTLGKSQLTRWQNILDTLVALLKASDDVVVLHASSAIWWLLYNNQRATALVWSKDEWKAAIREAYALCSGKDGVIMNEIEHQLGNIVRLIELPLDSHSSMEKD